MDNNNNYNDISKKMYRPHEEEEKKQEGGTTIAAAAVSASDNRKKPPPPPPPPSSSSSTASTIERDNDIKQRAKAAAAASSAGGVYHRKPPPLSPSSTTNRKTTADADAIAKSRGRRDNNNNNNNISNARQVSSSSYLRSSATTIFADDNSDANTNATKPSKLEEEVTAKARGKASINSSMMMKRAPPAATTRNSPSLNIKQLNRMETDVSAKEKARAGRRIVGEARAPANVNNVHGGNATNLTRMEADVAAKARAKAVQSAAISAAGSSGTAPPSLSSLNRMEADVAAKAKTRAGRRVSSIAMSAIRDQQQQDGRDSDDITAKKLSKAGGRSSSNQGAFATTRPGAVSSQVAGDDYESRIAYKTGTNRLAGSGNSSIKGGTSKHMDKNKKPSDVGGGSTAATIAAMGQRGGRSGGINIESIYPNKDGKGHFKDNGSGDDDHHNGDGLAVAFAVNEDDDEDVFIPSAVEYDPDAMKEKVPMHKKPQFRVYGLLSCTLFIIIAACTIGVLAIFEGNEAPYMPPTMAPTCIRCSIDFEEKIKLEVGSQKLNDPTTPEAQAMEWIIYDDPMQLEATAQNLIQRFLLAAVYYDTHQLNNWRSCNVNPEDDIPEAQNEEQLKEDIEKCMFLKVSGVEPLSFQAFPANRWLSSHTECDWAGILCDEMDQVRSIDLHGQGIQGPFPTILTKIPYAQTVSMQWNEFTGSLPEDIGSMKHLIHLELHHNSFTGSFPTTWSNARNLQLLNIAENFLDGQLPSDMGNFRNIKGLYMYRNNFSGTLPPELSNSKTMLFARLHRNNLTGTIPPSFGDMKLSELMLQSNEQLTGTIPTELGKLSDYLSDLRLSRTGLTGTIPEEIFSLSNMWRLDLYESDFSGTISPNITKLEGIELLRISNNGFTGTLPTDFSSMTNLNTLWLNGNKLSGSVPSSICNLKDEHNLEFVQADCLPDPTTGAVQITCDCCDVCCNSETGECDYSDYEE